MRRRAVLFHLQIIIIRKRDQNTYNKVTIVKKTNNETNLKFSDFSRDLFRFSYITSREIDPSYTTKMNLNQNKHIYKRDIIDEINILISMRIRFLSY